MDMRLSKLREIVKDREVWHAAVHGVVKNWTQQALSIFFFFFKLHSRSNECGLICNCYSCLISCKSFLKFVMLSREN